MRRTCSRMKPSASPKPASGPVFGETCPILMICDCAFAGTALRTAGAAKAPRPVLTRVRREIVLLSVIVSSVTRSSSVLSARSFEMLQHFHSQGLLLRGAPLAEAFARLEAELSGLYQFFEIRRRPRPAVDVAQHEFMDGERQIGADHVGIFQRTERRQPAAERRLDDVVDGL